MRWWVPAAIAVVIAACLAWLYAIEHVARFMASVALPVLGLLLAALWYILLTGLPWRRRLACFAVLVLGVGGIAAALKKLTVWDGSLSGGAVPRLVWRWSPKADEKLAVPAESALPPAPPEARAASDSFPQFLGPERTGVLPEVMLDPDWEARAPREVWRIPIGAGWSGFAVAAGRAVTQEQRGETELVTCYALATGGLLWAHSNDGRFSEAMGGDGPRATPTVHDGNVFAMGATGILDCLALETGAVVWSRQILEENGAENGTYGKACSPLIVDDMVIVTGGDKGGPALLAYATATGEPVWKTGGEPASYASPVLTTLAGRRQIVSVNASTVSGHDVATGKRLWNYEWPARYPKSSQPQPVGDHRLLVTASYGMGSALLEVTQGGGENTDASAFKVSEVWTANRMKTKFSNVCIRDGYAYGLDEGRLACLDVKTGELVWKGGKYGYGQNLLAGGHLLVQAERGFVALVEANPEKFVEVARVEALDGKTWNNPALAGEYLLVRNDREAVCFRVALAGGGRGPTEIPAP